MENIFALNIEELNQYLKHPEIRALCCVSHTLEKRMKHFNHSLRLASNIEKIVKYLSCDEIGALSCVSHILKIRLKTANPWAAWNRFYILMLKTKTINSLKFRPKTYRKKHVVQVSCHKNKLANLIVRKLENHFRIKRNTYGPNPRGVHIYKIKLYLKN